MYSLSMGHHPRSMSKAAQREAVEYALRIGWSKVALTLDIRSTIALSSPMPATQFGTEMQDKARAWRTLFVFERCDTHIVVVGRHGV